MHIAELSIVNFKSFKGRFDLKLNDGLNILVGDNEAGKSTILESINLALTATLNGKYIKNELSQYLFNKEVVESYIVEVNKEGGVATLPSIRIEIHFEGSGLGRFKGDDNLDAKESYGLYLEIKFDEQYKEEYADLIKVKPIKTLPIEYYDVYWGSFARDNAITGRSIPVKSALIDSSSSKFQNGSDVYIARIVKDFLDTGEVVAISQAHRRMKDTFSDDGSVKKVNAKLKTTTAISSKDVKLDVELSSKTAWESSLLMHLDDVPFHYVGKGEQSIVKTKLALGHKKSQEANVILIEEPENHLSHTKLNELIKDINDHRMDKQVVVSTHSSFVANKLGLKGLTLLSDHKTVTLDDLSKDTQDFFSKLAGYDTLRLILCKKAILVEGDSDELVVQKAYMVKNSGRLPIEDGVDVISVGTSFLRFLEIAEKVDKKVAVVTDNDGDVAALEKKYVDYLGVNKKANINIYFDTAIDTGSDPKFNYNTLEPKLLKANSLTLLNSVLGKSYVDEESLMVHMKSNKTDVALAIFETDEQVKYPQYIEDAIK